MRYLIGCVAFLLIYAGCSTTETTQVETEETNQAREQKSIPSWYSGGIHSSSDSLAIHGYSLASATDSLQAVELSTETALEYLRFEIDRELEDVRKALVESDDEETGTYNSPAFIINLRKSVLKLSLDLATLTHQHESSAEGVHYSYTQATISRSDLNNLLNDSLTDQRFLEHINRFI